MDNELTTATLQKAAPRRGGTGQLPGTGAARLEKYGGVIIDLVKLTRGEGDEAFVYLPAGKSTGEKGRFWHTAAEDNGSSGGGVREII